jgi:DNA-binding protein HU-beta
MNKSELIEAIAKEANLSKKDAEAAVNAYADVITKDLKKGEKVTLVGFGTYEVRKRAARKGKNPQTGEVIKIKAAKVPAFKAGKALKDAVNGAKK